MARSYNRIELIGNLTHDPELRQTSKGTPVCSFRLATDRTWKDESGGRHEDTAYHRIVAWKTLAEQCHQFLRKGRKVFVVGHLAYRTYTGKVDGAERTVAEIIINEMLLLDDKRPAPPTNGTHESPESLEPGDEPSQEADTPVL